MPRKPKRPCAFPGCPNLTDKQYCEQHEKTQRKKYNKYERRADVNIRYGRAWRRVRQRYVSAHPLCERCLEQGRMIPVEEVHHKVPLAEGGTHERSNLISLCKSCHSQIHAERGDRWNKDKKYTY